MPAQSMVGWVRRLSEEERKRVFESVNEALREIGKIEDRDVRRVLRTVVRFCYRIGGRVEYVGYEDLYVVRCIVPGGLGFLSVSHSGVGGYAGIYSEREISEFKVPDGWAVTVDAGARRVRGFRVAISRSVSGGSYSIEISPI